MIFLERGDVIGPNTRYRQRQWQQIEVCIYKASKAVLRAGRERYDWVGGKGRSRVAKEAFRYRSRG
jgi:hypothetical protein